MHARMYTSHLSSELTVAIWASPGAVLEPSWGRLGAVLGPSWAPVAACWQLAASGRGSRARWASESRSWPILAPYPKTPKNVKHWRKIAMFGILKALNSTLLTQDDITS